MTRHLILTSALAAAVGATLLFPLAASAHNAGHIILPSGKCLNVGAGNTVELPVQAQANTNAAGELDLIPGTAGDEFGARFAAEQGNSRVLPRHC